MKQNENKEIMGFPAVTGALRFSGGMRNGIFLFNSARGERFTEGGQSGVRHAFIQSHSR